VGSLRLDAVSGLRVVVAPGRGSRPGAFSATEARPVRQTPEECPFCAGHEDRTPPETLRLPPGGPSWSVRVVPNLYPALEPPDGTQEVVVHAPAHVAELADLGPEELALVAEAWSLRARTHCAAGFAYVLASVNEGPASGASLDHTHSQLSALGELPPLTALRQSRFAGACPLCVELADLDDALLVEERDGVVTYAPWASAVPLQLRSAPLAHRPDGFADPAGVAVGLGAVARAFVRLGPVSWNAWLQTAPCAGAPGFHWHLEAFPRVTTLAGLELGAGLPICVVDPADAAARLRG
jgi:UDPglucose--hexose-1-phosphate uridylyltransferase